MAFTGLTLISKSQVQHQTALNEEISKDELKLLDNPAFVALITDIALVALTAVAVTMLILAKNGINLGALNLLNSLNLHSIYAIVGVAGAVVLADVITLLMKQKAINDSKTLLEKEPSQEYIISLEPKVVENINVKAPKQEENIENQNDPLLNNQNVNNTNENDPLLSNQNVNNTNENNN